MALLVAWLTCARGGDVLLLRRNNVTLTPTRLSAQFRAGKSVRSRGPYTVHSARPPPTLFAELHAFLEEIPSPAFLFKGVKGADLKDALRRANPNLEQRSLRRGAIQTLSASGISEEELLNFSGKPRQVSKHDAPLFAKEIPDSFIDILLVGAGKEPLLNQLFKPLFRCAV